MFFKKKQDKIRRCPEGHILDPSWTHCPYCQDQAEPAAPAAPSYSAGPGFAPPPSHSAPPAYGQPPVYAPPAPAAAAPPARQAGGLDDNLDKTVVNPRVPAAPPPPAAAPPSLLETAQAFNEDGEDDPELSRVMRPGALSAPTAAAPPPAYAVPPVAPTPPPVAAAPPRAPVPPPPAPGAPPAPALPREPAAIPSPGSDELTRVLPRSSGPRSLVAWLVVVDGDYRGRDFRLSGPRLRVGIAPDCEISLPEESYLSRHHAELELVEGDYVLRDLASRNGSYVNGERVESCTLRDGDAVRLGLTHMIYRTLLI